MRKWLALVPVAAAVTGGCSQARDESSVETTARNFFGAVTSEDGSRACALLTPRARSALETGGSRCDEEITKLPLEGGEAGPAEIWGEQARIRMGGDTVFLTRWASSWKITAAGCEHRTGEPYDCEVEG
ncbi:hypothetical protein ABGB12_30635 [Actinocorallia sp. B10E7]|uniref:hypothetical protein n=1 Tax=Actinocorallia sp. B10E7 TaxID=3153558 RepID=UPI00325E4A8D